MSAQRCTLCRGLLDFAATANRLTTCTSCALRALRASRQGTRARVVAAADGEWSVFLSAVRQVVRADGTVHQNDVRPLIRGRIFHKRIGPFYRRAADEGILEPLRREESKDSVGRNTHHDSGVYTLRSAA